MKYEVFWGNSLSEVLTGSENAVLLKLATPELTRQYSTVLAPENLATHFAGENL